LSNDGRLLAASVQEGSVMQVWDVASGEVIVRISREQEAFWHPSFSADGSTLAVGMFDGTAQTFDTATGLPLKTYRGHSDAVEWAVFSGDGSQLLTSSRDATARLWDAQTATELRRFGHSDAVSQSVLTSDGMNVFTASIDGTARQWSAAEEGFSFIAGDGEVTALSFSGDGARLVGAAGDSIRVFDLAADKVILDAPTVRARLVAFSPAGDTFLAVSAYQSALVDATDGHLVLPPLSSSGQSVEGLASSAASFSGDGRLVLASLPAAGNAEILYDAATGQTVGAFELETAVLAQDGRRVAGWNPGRYSIYDAATGAAVGNIGLGQLDYRRVDVQLTPEGSRLVSGDHDNVVRVRDIATQSILLEMRGHGAPIRQVRVSADGRYALSAGDDGGARLWSLETGELLRFFAGHAGQTVTGIAISPDGDTVALGSADGTVIVAPSSLEQLTESVCALLGRDLTADERNAYGIEGAEPTCP
jgi:WD40 repeat protein